MSQRASILIRCSREEAELIRLVARRERRTISGFILNAIMPRLQVRAKAEPQAPPKGERIEEQH